MSISGSSSFFNRALYAFLAARGPGVVLVAPLRLRLRTGWYREPALLLLLSATDPRRCYRVGVLDCR
jgi:hypothetical protein